MRIIIAIISALVSLLGIYAREGTITETNYAEDTYTIVDKAGLAWKMTGIEDLFVGDEVAMLVWNNGTESSIYDDVVLNVR